MCDLYMMNRVGPQFWHIVLSWESLAKRLNSSSVQECMTEFCVLFFFFFLKGHYPFSEHLTRSQDTLYLLGPMNHTFPPTSSPVICSNAFLVWKKKKKRGKTSFFFSLDSVPISFAKTSSDTIFLVLLNHCELHLFSCFFIYCNLIKLVVLMSEIKSQLDH